MNINYDSPKTVSKAVWFYGDNNGKSFTIVATWNEWDGWDVEVITWDDGEDYDEREEIIESFLEKMN